MVRQVTENKLYNKKNKIIWFNKTAHKFVHHSAFFQRLITMSDTLIWVLVMDTELLRQEVWNDYDLQDLKGITVRTSPENHMFSLFIWPLSRNSISCTGWWPVRRTWCVFSFPVTNWKLLCQYFRDMYDNFKIWHKLRKIMLGCISFMTC